MRLDDVRAEPRLPPFPDPGMETTVVGAERLARRRQADRPLGRPRTLHDHVVRLREGCQRHRDRLLEIPVNEGGFRIGTPLPSSTRNTFALNGKDSAEPSSKSSV